MASVGSATVSSESGGSAATRWRGQLAEWAIPPAILDQAVQSPWSLPKELFRVDAPAQVDTPSTAAARQALPEGGVVLDVGCGGGAAGLALADRAGEIVGVDSRADMLAEFEAAAGRVGVDCRSVQGDWPAVADQTPIADVVVCHHVFYNVAELPPFVQALTSHARNRVVVELPRTHPTARMAPLWEHFWGVVRPSGPTADDAIAVLQELGIEPDVSTFTAAARRLADFNAEVEQARIHLCLPPERTDEVAALLERMGPPVARELYALSWPGGA